MIILVFVMQYNEQHFFADPASYQPKLVFWIPIII
jgi:hypothetical protein